MVQKALNAKAKIDLKSYITILNIEFLLSSKLFLIL